MSTIERREYHQSRTTRTLSPTRSNQNLSQFDNNLDNLLEDLQSSVSRPGSSLGNTNYKETRTVTYGNGKNDSLTRVQHLQAANPTTVISDESYSSYKPGETVKTVKTYKENYASYNVNSSISPEKTRMQTNINKLDTLLDDLQQARQGTLDRGISDAGIDPGLLEPTSNRQISNKRTVHRELVYDQDSQRNKRSGSVEREIIINRDDGTYGDIRSTRHQSASPASRSGTLQKSYNYSESRNAISPEIESNNPDINPNILAQLDPNLLPPPNTKVTTTIKTYTYEIPGNGPVSPKLSETVYSSNPSTPSQSFAYNKIENTNSYVRPVSPNLSGHTTTKYVENITTKNEGYPRYNTTPNSGKKTYIYNETTTRNINDYPPSPKSPRSPRSTEKQVHIYNKNTTNLVDYPREEPTHHTYIVNETNTTRNVTYPRNGYHSPDRGYPPQTTVIYKQDLHTTNNNYNPNGGPYDPSKKGPPYNRPNDPNVNISYKYSTHTTSSNNYRGHPNDESEPLLHPRPFPTDGNVGNDVDGPPKHLDKLMAEIGKEPPNSALNAGYTLKEAERAQRKEVDKLTQQSTAVTQKKSDIKDAPKSKNIAGPPVYYPPGHEMFMHKEESGGYRAEGGMMKESGKYKYEAKSSSKSKSSSGVAVVPVCLPLCCGLPCVIM